LRVWPGAQPLRGPDVHRAAAVDPALRREAQAQRGGRGDPRQARGGRGRLARARDDQPQDREDAPRRRRQGSPPAHLQPAHALALLLRHRHAESTGAHRQQPRGRGDRQVRDRGLAGLPLAGRIAFGGRGGRRLLRRVLLWRLPGAARQGPGGSRLRARRGGEAQRPRRRRGRVATHPRGACMNAPRVPRVAEYLLKAKVIDEFQMKSALAHQAQWGQRLTRVFNEMRLAPENKVVAALAHALKLQPVDLSAIPPDLAALKKLDADYCMEKGVFPCALKDQGKTLFLAMCDPTDFATTDEVEKKTRCRLKLLVAGETALA